MKTSLLVVVLASVAFTAAQEPATAQPAGQTAQASSSAAPVIKDPAEYNAYVSAIQQQDPNAKISGLEAFVTQYPNSIVKKDALEVLMGTYQQAGNQEKTTSTAEKVLGVDPNNMRALALLAFSKRVAAQGGVNPAENLAAAKKYGEQGLGALPNYTKPAEMSDADFQKLKDQMSVIFNAAVGVAAYQDKDYATAAKDLRVAVDATPNDFSLVYPLALAYLQQEPPDNINGIWFAARAAAVAPAAYQAQIEKYAKSQYVHYHAGEDGWPEVLALAKANPKQPADFTVKPAPTLAEQAHKLVTGKKPETMDFAEWQLVLSEGNPEDADAVWTAIKGKSLQFRALVITAAPEKLELAATLDDIEKKRTDVEMTMRATIPARLMPKEGTEIPVEGTPASYTAKPFVITMEEGGLLTQPKPPARRK
jgi:tetratricopeptide (TPR) repeat protein